MRGLKSLQDITLVNQDSGQGHFWGIVRSYFLKHQAFAES